MPAVFVENASVLFVLMSGVFCCVGIMLMSLAAGFSATIMIIMGCIFLLVGLAMLAGVVKVVVTINELSNQLIVEKIRLYCFHSQTTYDLTSILGAELQMRRGRRSDVYRIVIHSTTHGQMPMSVGWNNLAVDAKQSFVTGFNTYLSQVRGGAPIVIPGVAGQVSVTVVMPQQNAPLLGAAFGQPSGAGGAVGYQSGGMPQQQQYQYATYQQMPVAAPVHQNPPMVMQPNTSATNQPVVVVAASNPYAVQNQQQPSAPPPPYSAVGHQQTY